MPRVTAEPYDFEFDPRTTALVVIDMQRDFVDPGGFGEALGNDVSLLRPRRRADAAGARSLPRGRRAGHSYARGPSRPTCPIARRPSWRAVI